MYRKTEDFIKDWTDETRFTLKILDNLTDESLQKKVTGDGRSLGFLAWHIIHTMEEMPGRAGLRIGASVEREDVPASAEEISAVYKKAAGSVLKAVTESWNDEDLLVEIEMYGQRWLRGYALFALMKHQIHHRAQMTVLIRQAGLKVPGIYGPAREEWAALGTPPMK